MYEMYLDFLRWQIESQFFETQEEAFTFLSSHLLCTVMCLIGTPDEVLYFWAADGLLYQNDSVIMTLISPHNQPTYPAYALYPEYGVESDEVTALTPSNFSQLILPAELVKIAGITTDGLLYFPELLAELKQFATTSIMLQLCLNRQSLTNPNITDNVTVGFLTRKDTHHV